MHLTNWKARRAGPRITVTGTDADGKPAKIVGVDVIEPPECPIDSHVIATDKHGTAHTLEL